MAAILAVGYGTGLHNSILDPVIVHTLGLNDLPRCYCDAGFIWKVPADPKVNTSAAVGRRHIQPMGNTRKIIHFFVPNAKAGN